MDIKRLYSELILDHSKNPRNYGILTKISSLKKGHNPLCGDKIEIYIEILDEKIQNISFLSIGCALSKASASLMTEIALNRKIYEIRKIFKKFKDFLTHEENLKNSFLKSYSKLAAFENVKNLPSRIKCVLLPWYTLNSALFQKKDLNP